ncbi:MAG: TetR/AcrR family transcriptional regulator [Deltaproteobacteria bacterium]|nr:MAG: TetR/AcrR family transcriptional regulator [Deltaproteobacteria bacterium]
MNRRQASKQETRQLILAAARLLFAQKGMEECTIRDIAKAAGVSPASVVVHFKSKTALLEEALNRDLENALTAFIASMPEDQGLLERLLHLATDFFRLYDQNRDLYRALIRHTIFEPEGETPHMTSLSERYIRFLAGLIESEQNRGRIKPEVDPMMAAAACFSLYLGALIMLFRQAEMSVEAVAEVLAAMTGQYLDGLTERIKP